MTPFRPGRRSIVWLGALGLTLVALALDSAQRLESIRRITDQRVGEAAAPVADPSSPTGYQGSEHRLVLPAIDGYHWVLQTERMAAGGGWRIRTTDYDDAPVGREVHWSGVMRWWGAGVAAAYRVAHPGLSFPQALEAVVPWANTAALVVLLLVLTPLIAASLGAVSAALFCLGTVAVFPFYEYFVVGYFDHHGVAAMCGVMSVVFLAGGGGGWIRAGDPGERGRAVRWFVASAVAAGTGLWINAATLVPVLAGVGLGALVSVVWLAREAPGRAGPVVDPGLWRVWGLAGAATSLALYLLEYFPAHLGVRLEVNHPLYALAWAGAGDFLARIGAPVGAAAGRRPWRWLAVDALAVLALPAVILATRVATFRLSDTFLYTLHQSYIIEFLPLGGQLAQMTGREVAGRLSALPLLSLPLAAALWPAGRSGRAEMGWKAFLLAVGGVGAAFAHTALGSVLGGRLPLVLVGDAVVVGLLVVLCRPAGGRPVPAPRRGVLALGLAPATLLLGMSLAQVRWVGISAALWLATLVIAAARGHGDEPSLVGPASRKAALGLLLAATFVVGPAFYLTLPSPSSDPPQQIARDVAHWLRARVGSARAVVFTSPNATTWMAWFGGFPGIGTLYWENLEGLKASADIYTAPTADSARALLARRGVTHLVVFPWDSGLELLRRTRAAVEGRAEPPAFLPTLEESLRTEPLPRLPPWLVPLPYPAPEAAGLGRLTAVVLEVVPDQPPEITLVRTAQYFAAVRSAAGLEAALRASVEIRPSAAGLALLAQLENARGRAPEFAAALDALRASLRETSELALEDRVNAAVAFALGRDAAETGRQTELALEAADEASLRRLSRGSLSILVDLSRQLGLDRTHPEALARAASFLPPAGTGR